MHERDAYRYTVAAWEFCHPSVMFNVGKPHTPELHFITENPVISDFVCVEVFA